MEQEIHLRHCGLVVPGLPLILLQMSRTLFWFPFYSGLKVYNVDFVNVYFSYCFKNGLTRWHIFARLDIKLMICCTDPRKDLSFFNVVFSIMFFTAFCENIAKILHLILCKLAFR